MASSTLTPWSVPQLDFVKELLNKEDFSKKPYSVIDPRHVFRNARELAELVPIFPVMNSNRHVAELVSFKPERCALHALIVEITLNLKLTDEHQLQAVIYDLYKKLEQTEEYKTTVNHAYQTRNDYQQILQNIRAGKITYANASDIERKLLSHYEKIKTFITTRSNNIGQYVNGYTIEDAAFALTLDTFYKKNVVPTIDLFIKNIVSNLVKEKPEIALAKPNKSNRWTIMIAGGQASGKSTAVELLKHDLQAYDLALNDFVNLNADNIKPLIITPGTVNPYLYSQLAQPEASLVRVKIQRIIEARIQEGTAPHLYVDQVFLGRKKLNFSLNDQGVVAVVISTRVEDAMIRSFQRGLQAPNHQGRFEHTTGVLAGHKGVAEKFFDTIFQYLGKPFVIALYDNNGEQTKPPKEIMRLELSGTPAKITIFSEKKLKEFIKKMKINVNAIDLEQLYDHDADQFVEEFYQQFIARLKGNKCLVIGKSDANQLVSPIQMLQKLSFNTSDRELNPREKTKPENVKGCVL